LIARRMGMAGHNHPCPATKEYVKEFIMNRCITCGKIVTPRKAENVIEQEGHRYLVCCPMCKKEFERDPQHYLAVAKSVFWDYGVDAYSQTTASDDDRNKDMADPQAVENARLLHNLQGSFERIQDRFKTMTRHFDEMSESGGLNGLRTAMTEHRVLLNGLSDELRVHAGVCRFVVSVVESTARGH
jgi:YHS domain-containing protein